jgi:hypothetical protein
METPNTRDKLCAAVNTLCGCIIISTIVIVCLAALLFGIGSLFQYLVHVSLLPRLGNEPDDAGDINGAMAWFGIIFGIPFGVTIVACAGVAFCRTLWRISVTGYEENLENLAKI